MFSCKTKGKGEGRMSVWKIIWVWGGASLGLGRSALRWTHKYCNCCWVLGGLLFSMSLRGGKRLGEWWSSGCGTRFRLGSSTHRCTYKYCSLCQHLVWLFTSGKGQEGGSVESSIGGWEIWWATSVVEMVGDWIRFKIYSEWFWYNPDPDPGQKLH